MWAPVDILAFPSENDRICATQAILDLKKQLEEALEALVQAQRRVDHLKQDINQRKAWLAPVRLIPSEVLSIVFLNCVEDDWRAPLTLQAICRYWRNVLLGTHDAWRFIPWDRHYQSTLASPVSSPIAGSEGYPLHIHIPGNFGPKRALKRIQSRGSRVVCLVDSCIVVATEGRFPNLETLSLVWGGESILNIPYLFQLKTLSIKMSRFVHETVYPLPRGSSIQHLDVHVGGVYCAVPLIECCSSSLRALILSFNSDLNINLNLRQTAAYASRRPIECPLLHSVFIEDRGEAYSEEKILFNSPALKTYAQRGLAGLVVSFDLTDILHLSEESGDDVDLSSPPRPHLRVLELSRLGGVMGQLLEEGVCPELETLVIREPCNARAIEKKLKKREIWARKPVEVLHCKDFVDRRWIRPIFTYGHDPLCMARWRVSMEGDGYSTETSETLSD